MFISTMKVVLVIRKILSKVKIILIINNISLKANIIIYIVNIVNILILNNEIFRLLFLIIMLRSH